MRKQPSYLRTMDSFSDEIITRTFQSQDGRYWYAVLDVGPKSWPHYPDYIRCDSDKGRAIKNCALAIRTGRLEERVGGYDLRFKFQEHWAKKEKEQAE